MAIAKSRNAFSFPGKTGLPVFARTYSREGKESWQDVTVRCVDGLIATSQGNLRTEERALLYRNMRDLKSLPSGRWLWVGGVPWIEIPENFSGAYNCTSTNIQAYEHESPWAAFGWLLDLGMMGCGTGAVLEPKYINTLPKIKNTVYVNIQGSPGEVPAEERLERTELHTNRNTIYMIVGDSRQGWVKAYQRVLEIASEARFGGEIFLNVYLGNVRPYGENLKGFGGVANPAKLAWMFSALAEVTNGAVGRQLNSLECCMAIDIGSETYVAGNVRRAAGMRQGAWDDDNFTDAKLGLYAQDEQGQWYLPDPRKSVLRIANHTRIYHHKPSYEEIEEAVAKQYHSGEGAIMWAGEAIYRSNRDLLSESDRANFLYLYNLGIDYAREFLAVTYLRQHGIPCPEEELDHRMERDGTNPCGEILGSNFHCVSGETLLITRCGMYSIKDIVGSEVEIWNGSRWSKVTPFKTGSDRKLYRVKFGDGSYIDATEQHRWFVKDRFQKKYVEVQTKDLMSHSNYPIHTEPFEIAHTEGIDVGTEWAYTLGCGVGDGTPGKTTPYIVLYGNKTQLETTGIRSKVKHSTYTGVIERVKNLEFTSDFLTRLKHDPETLNIIAAWNRDCILSFIAGLADTDGSNTDGNGIRIYVSDFERGKRFQLLLIKCGIRSSLSLIGKKGDTTNYGVRRKDLYALQITDCQNIPCQRLDVSKGVKPKCKGKWQIVRSVEELPGLHETFCFNEPELHKGVFGATLAGNCNLSEIHLNQINPYDLEGQKEAFQAGALSVAALLHHQFPNPVYQKSRELDPIVGVSCTGMFDFFVQLFGADWLKWWEAGRPQEWGQTVEYTILGNLWDVAERLLPTEVMDDSNPEGFYYWRMSRVFTELEKAYLCYWREIVEHKVWEYCDRTGLKRPNRCTTVQPSGTKSLLTGASPGWHPPKGQRFIRRITFDKNDPVALACLDYGYSVVPAQGDKDDNGYLLTNPFDPRCTEWLVEIPCEVSWANIAGAEEVDVSQFSALAQFDFYMQVQGHYTRHNTSATIEMRGHEIEPLALAIHKAIQNDEGYISACLSARFDDHETFPRLPFEPIDQATYQRMVEEVEQRRTTEDFHAALKERQIDSAYIRSASGPAGCDSDKCLLS